MNCREITEHISLAVDNRLEGRLREDFDKHIGLCQECRSEYELERLTKHFIRNALRRSSAPADLATQIISQLPSSQPEEADGTWFTRLWSAPRVKPAFAAAVVAVIALLFFVSLPLNVQHSHASPNDNNIIHQTFNNYDAILAGALLPEITSGDYGEVKSYCQKRVNYNVRVPKISDKCKLVGALVSNYDGEQLTHIVYKDDDKTIYLYQVDMATVLEGKRLSIPEKARETLLQTGWYIETPHPNCTLAMWVVDNTLCSAISDMNKNQLIAYLSYPEE